MKLRVGEVSGKGVQGGTSRAISFSCVPVAYLAHAFSMIDRIARIYGGLRLWKRIRDIPCGIPITPTTTCQKDTTPYAQKQGAPKKFHCVDAGVHLVARILKQTG